MESNVTKVRALSSDQYAKFAFRARQAALPYPEKVRQVVMMQRRIAPIYASRGIVIVPWKVEG